MGPPSVQSQTSASSSQAEASRPKTRSACDRCHQQKLRCSKTKGQTSCERCIQLKTGCRYSPRNRRNARNKPPGTTPGTERWGLALRPVRPEMQRSASVTLTVEGSQYNRLSFPDAGTYNAESLGHFGYNFAFSMLHADRATDYVLPSYEGMVGEVSGNHSLDIFDPSTALQHPYENPNAEPGYPVNSITWRLTSLNMALYECANKLPHINTYRMESVCRIDIPHDLKSNARVAALLALDKVFCVTKNFIDVTRNLFPPSYYEAPTLAATAASLDPSHVTPQLLTNHQEPFPDPLLQLATMEDPHGPSISSSAIQSFSYLDEATVLLFLSCHCRLIEIYEVIFQAMRQCIEQSYTTTYPAVSTILPQIKQIDGSGGASFPALRVDFDGPQLPPATASMYLALIITLSSQLWAQVGETLKGGGSRQGLSNSLPIAHIREANPMWDIAIKRTDNMSRIIEIIRQLL